MASSCPVIQDGLGLICIEGSETLKIDSDVVVKDESTIIDHSIVTLIMLFPSSCQEVASEVDIFSALTDVFRETDPAVVMGYARVPAVTPATVHPACHAVPGSLAVGMLQSGNTNGSCNLPTGWELCGR